MSRPRGRGGPQPQPGPNPGAGPGAAPAPAPQPTPSPTPGPAPAPPPVSPLIPNPFGGIADALAGGERAILGYAQVAMGVVLLLVAGLLIASQTSAGRSATRAAVTGAKLAITKRA